MADLLIRVATGFAVALVCTPAGVSGAFLLLPIQVIALGAPSPAVSATNLLYNVVSTPAGVVGFARRELLDRALAIQLCIGSGAGVVVGVLLRTSWLASASRFSWVAAIVLGALGIRLLLHLRGEDPNDGAEARPLPWIRVVPVGFAAGVVGGIYGMGGAAFVVPWLVTVEHLPLRRVAGAGIVTTFVTSVVGLAAFGLASVIGFSGAQAPEWANGLALGVGGAVGAVVGTRLQSRVPTAVLRGILAVAAISAAVRLLAS